MFIFYSISFKDDVRVITFLLLLFIYLFIYVAVPGLSCGMQGLLFFFKLWHVESSSLTRDRIPVPCTGRVDS